MIRAPFVLVSSLLVLLTGCAALIAQHRPEGQDCSVVGAVFRETRGGVGKEFVDLEGPSGYAVCPQQHRVPRDVDTSWANYSAELTDSSRGARPIDADVQRSWTEPHDGVLYKYTLFALYFRGCDYWYDMASMGKCAAPHNGAVSQNTPR